MAEPRPRPGDRRGREEWVYARSPRRRSLEMAVPEGGAPAGLGVGTQGKGRGKRRGNEDLEWGKRKRREGRSRRDSGQGSRTRDWYWEAYLERQQTRYRERSVKRKVKGAGPESSDDRWGFPPVRKAGQPGIYKTADSEEDTGDSSPERSEILKEPRLQLRRPKICFNLGPELSPRWSQWSAASNRPRGSVINELAKMGDPDLLEMVEHEGRTPPRGWRGRAARGGPSVPQHMDPGGRWREYRGRSLSGEPCARQTAAGTLGA